MGEYFIFSFPTLSFSEKSSTTFCTSNLPFACSHSVRKGRERIVSVSAVLCLSVPVSRKPLTALTYSNVNRLAIGFLAKSTTACSTLRHTVSNKSISVVSDPGGYFFSGFRCARYSLVVCFTLPDIAGLDMYGCHLCHNQYYLMDLQMTKLGEPTSSVSS